MRNFAITGVAGYVAPRHLKAIRDTGNHLLAAADPHDSVGILDQYFPDAAFFTEIERFDRHLEKQRRKDPSQQLHYMSICSPNHLHDAHIRLALRLDASAICEKPLVLKPSNLDYLQELEEEHDGSIYTVLQLRVHPKLLELREKIRSENTRRRSIRLTYITARGTWYRYSWKGDEEKSGGVVTNIGIHLFDMLMWLFGPPRQSRVHVRELERIGGYLELENADVEWFLSIDANDLPAEIAGERRTYRSITVDGEEIEFSGGFTDLHTRVYEAALAGDGFRIEDARPAIELVYGIRNAPLAAPTGSTHPAVTADSRR
jgi:UDP-N-acetyl-2-amino-2-deoxyglucuronate dehydrogenase